MSGDLNTNLSVLENLACDLSYLLEADYRTLSIDDIAAVLKALEKHKRAHEPINIAKLNRELCDKDGHVLSIPMRECLRCHSKVGISAPGNSDALRRAAQAVIDRWETPLWKDVPATAQYINDLRMALSIPIPDFLRNQENLKAERAADELLGAKPLQILRQGISHAIDELGNEADEYDDDSGNPPRELIFIRGLIAHLNGTLIDADGIPDETTETFVKPSRISKDVVCAHGVGNPEHCDECTKDKGAATPTDQVAAAIAVNAIDNRDECGACDKPGEHCARPYGICVRAIENSKGAATPTCEHSYVWVGSNIKCRACGAQEPSENSKGAAQSIDCVSCDCDYKQDGDSHSFDCPSLSTDKGASQL